MDQLALSFSWRPGSSTTSREKRSIRSRILTVSSPKPMPLLAGFQIWKSPVGGGPIRSANEEDAVTAPDFSSRLLHAETIVLRGKRLLSGIVAAWRAPDRAFEAAPHLAGAAQYETAGGACTETMRGWAAEIPGKAAPLFQNRDSRNDQT